VSDTPISDSTPHNVAELGMLCRRLERQLNALDASALRLGTASRQLLEMACEQKERIKQLEIENDAMRADLLLWNKQEAK
tara:strand:- start:43 stop:282 length:240 start_codon:yes stop_codon:yes gene_type:complete